MTVTTRPVRISLLGEVRLEVDNYIVPLPQREGLLRLFVRLVLARGQPQSRRALAFSLWPDVPEADALANLRRHLHLLRAALPPSVQSLLTISPQAVTWADSLAYWLDVRAFSGDSDHVDELEGIASIYRGDLAPEIYTDEVIVAQREALRSRYLALLKKLVQLCHAQGQTERGLRWARRLTEQDPWDEEAVRLQMTLEASLGDRAAVIKTYQRLADSLAHELRAQPMPETMALYSAILNRRRLQPASVPAEPRFVGRARELAQLSAWLADLRDGQGRIAFIIGAAGVGKTTLLREALRRFMAAAGESAPRLFWGHCPPPARGALPLAYAPWRQVFTIAAPLLARSADVATEWLSRLLLLAPDLSALCPGLLPPAEPDAGGLRVAIRQALISLATDRPLILALEDVHWADAESLAVLAELIEVFQNAPLLVLATQRAEDAPAALRDLQRELHRCRCGEEMLLSAFSEEETCLYIEKALEGRPLGPALCAEIGHYARGLPLLLREATESLKDAHQGAPATLREAIALRLNQLSGQARAALEAAAVLGFAFSAQTLEAMLGWPQADVVAAMDDLRGRRLIAMAPPPALDDYAFSHQLIHQVVLDLLPAEQTTHLHARAAHALEQAGANRPELALTIASHYEAAQRPLPAARFWLSHAQSLIELGSFAQADEAITRALALAEGAEDELEYCALRGQALIQQGLIAHHRGQTREALAHLDAALAACREFPLLYAEALTRKAHVLFICDRYAEAHQAAGQSLAIAQALGDQQAAANALNIRGVVGLLMGYVDIAIEDLRASLAAETGLPSLRTAHSLNYLGTALVFVQDYPQAQQALAQAAALARQGGIRRLEGAALTMLGQIALNQGRYSEAIRIYSQAIQASEDIHLPGLWSKLAGRGLALLRMGRPAEARGDFARGLEIARQIESIYADLLMRTYLALADLAAGRAPQDSLADLEAEAGARGIHAVALTAGLGCASLARLLGEHETALAACQRALRAAEASGVPQFAQHAGLEAALIQAMTGALDPDRLEALTQAACAAGELPQQARAGLALAIHLEQRGDPAGALDAAQRALALARACPDLPLVGECLIALRCLHEALGQARDADACRAELRELAEQAYAPLALALAPDPALRRLLRSAI